MRLLGIKSKSTQKLFQSTINNIEAFGKIRLNDISVYDEDIIYGLLQEWIIWNRQRGIATSSIKCYFNTLRSYLWYVGIKLDRKDIVQHLKFPVTV